MISIEQAIEEIKNGKMLVVVDDEDRENEGDIVFAGTFCDAEKVNFAITHAKGILCTPISIEVAKRLKFVPMVSSNTSNHETAFTISVDAKDATTGVSAVERDETIRLIANSNSQPSDFVAPGHIFPLIAKDGGVLERTGHTEGSIDLCKMAGLAPVAVICEVVKENGEMARRDDLNEFCKKFNIHMISIAQIVEYRLKHERLIKVSEKKDGYLLGKPCNYYDIKDHKGNIHKAFIFGELSENSNVKFIKIQSEIDFLTSKKYQEFLKYFDFLEKNGGILVFLDDNASQTNLIKEYGIGAQILNYFGIKNITILSSSEDKEFIGLSGFGLNVKGYKSL